MTRSLTAFLATSLFTLGALAQPHRAPRRRAPARHAAAPAVAPQPPQQAPELISVPVADIDRMMRQMRVWLFSPPASSTSFGLAGAGSGRRVWALLPSCRQRVPDDPRDPCPVDRVIFEAVGGDGSVSNLDPVGLAPGSDARRVQSFVVPAGVPRVRVRLMALNAQVRYEAVVDADRLVELPAPTGSDSPGGFRFDLAQYPAR